MNSPKMKNAKDTIRTLKVVAMVLMFAGLLLLAFSGYIYATETDGTPSTLAGYLSVGDQKVSLPMVGGIVSIAIAAPLFFLKLPVTSAGPPSRYDTGA